MLRDDGLDAFIAAWEKQPLFATQAKVDAAHRAERHARRRRLDPEQLAQSLEQMGLGAMPDYWSVMPAHRDRIALIAGADDAKYTAISHGLPAKHFESDPGLRPRSDARATRAARASRSRAASAC